MMAKYESILISYDRMLSIQKVCFSYSIAIKNIKSKALSHELKLSSSKIQVPSRLYVRNGIRFPLLELWRQGNILTSLVMSLPVSLSSADSTSFSHSNTLQQCQASICPVCFPGWKHVLYCNPQQLINTIMTPFWSLLSMRPITYHLFTCFSYLFNVLSCRLQLMIKLQSHRASDHVTTYIRPQNKANRR